MWRGVVTSSVHPGARLLRVGVVLGMAPGAQDWRAMAQGARPRCGYNKHDLTVSWFLVGKETFGST